MTENYEHRAAICAACGRPILAIEIISPIVGGAYHRRVLLDPLPAPDGDVVITDGRPTRPAVRADVEGRFPLYRSHFFSCPEHLVTVDA